jgi:hypothetical protein
MLQVMRWWWVCGVGMLLLACLGCSEDEHKDTTELVAARLTVTPAVGTTTTLFRFHAEGLTKAGRVVPVAGTRWDFQGDGTFDTPWLKTDTNAYQYSSAGLYWPCVVVRDAEGRTATATAFVTVDSAAIPVFVQLTADPAEGTPETEFTFTVLPIEVMEGDQVIKAGFVRWDWEGDGVYDTPFTPYVIDPPGEDNPPVATHRYDTIGEMQPTAQVRTLDDRYGTGSTLVTVICP